jgi:hypothetical protein
VLAQEEQEGDVVLPPPTMDHKYISVTDIKHRSSKDVKTNAIETCI